MNAYQQLVKFLRELGAVCTWEGDRAQTAASEWLVGGARLVLTLDAEHTLRLFQETAADSHGRTDLLLDHITDLAMMARPVLD